MSGNPKRKVKAMSEATQEVAPLVESDLDELGQMMLAKVKSWAETVEQAELVIKAAKSDDANLAVIAMREGSEGFDKYLALIEQAEAILATIDAINKPKVKMPTEEEVKEAETVSETVRGEAKAGVNYLLSLYGDAAKNLIPEVLSKRTRKSNSGEASSHRPRLTAISVADKDGNELVLLNDTDSEAKPADKPTFSALSAWLSEDSGSKVETKNLQEHAFAVAGTQDLSTVKSVEFEVTVGDKHYFIAAQPKSK